MLADFGRGSYLQKARQQPDKVRQVVDKARTDGLLPTIEAVQHKLNEPLPMGYANAGRVVEVGSGVVGFQPGDRIASTGPHAEWVVAPTTLASKVPDGGKNVPAEHAAFATVGAIAVQSTRLAAPALGERFVVSGLGLIGLLTVQLLRRSGCHVLALDFSPERLALVKSFGAQTVDLRNVNPLAAAGAFTDACGVDGVIIAAATDSDEPVQQAAQMCRKRGRIVLVGVAGLQLNRADFYEKELSFQVSCSYGPGRYDSSYEDKAQDYPIGFVRWTAARNQRAILELIDADHLDVEPLISHRFPIDQAKSAYDLLVGGDPSLGIILDYPPSETSAPNQHVVHLRPASPRSQPIGHRPVRLGFIGAGSFTRKVLLPALTDQEVDLAVIASRNGTTAALAGRQFGFERATTRADSDVLEAEDIDAVFVTTRHDTHASYVQRALECGKHVFVEKPLTIATDQLEAVRGTLDDLGPASPLLMVGFNRRFAPQAAAIANHVRGSGPMAIQMTINTGHVPRDSWLHDQEVGVGRIAGEGCHFIDSARFIIGSPIADIHTTYLGTPEPRDSAVIAMTFDDGSIATISYLSNGNSKVPRERLEVFSQGRVARLENFRRLTGAGFRDLTPARLARQDTGHAAAVAAFLTAIREGAASPIPPHELLEVSEASLVAAGASVPPRAPSR